MPSAYSRGSRGDAQLPAMQPLPSPVGEGNKDRSVARLDFGAFSPETAISRPRPLRAFNAKRDPDLRRTAR